MWRNARHYAGMGYDTYHVNDGAALFVEFEAFIFVCSARIYLRIWKADKWLSPKYSSSRNHFTQILAWKWVCARYTYGCLVSLSLVLGVVYELKQHFASNKPNEKRRLTNILSIGTLERKGHQIYAKTLERSNSNRAYHTLLCRIQSA